MKYNFPFLNYPNPAAHAHWKVATPFKVAAVQTPPFKQAHEPILDWQVAPVKPAAQKHVKLTVPWLTHWLPTPKHGLAAHGPVPAGETVSQLVPWIPERQWHR